MALWPKWLDRLLDRILWGDKNDVVWMRVQLGEKEPAMKYRRVEGQVRFEGWTVGIVLEPDGWVRAYPPFHMPTEVRDRLEKAVRDACAKRGLRSS